MQRTPQYGFQSHGNSRLYDVKVFRAARTPDDAVDRLDASSFLESGSKVVAGEGLEETGNSEVVGKFGGPCRGRTYGPLIKSPAEELPQDTQQEESTAKGEDS